MNQPMKEVQLNERAKVYQTSIENLPSKTGVHRIERSPVCDDRNINRNFTNMEKNSKYNFSQDEDMGECNQKREKSWMQKSN